MRIGLTVLALAKAQTQQPSTVASTGPQVGEGWNICPSNIDQESPESGVVGGKGCYHQNVQWIDGNSDVECKMVNKACIKVDCSDNTRIQASFRADLFQHNDVHDGDFIQQLQDGHAELRHRTDGSGSGHNAKLPNEDDTGDSCGYTIDGSMIKIDWDYEECEEFIMLVDHPSEGKITYEVRIKANDKDRFNDGEGVIEMFVDTTVEAECVFDTRVEVDAAGFWMNQENVEALGDAQGSFKDEFECRFYRDEDYKDQIKSTDIINMGERIYGMVHSAIPLPGLSYDLVEVIVMDANGCNDFDTCANDDNLYWVKDEDGPSSEIDAQSGDNWSAEFGEDVLFDYLSFGFTGSRGINQNNVKIRCVIDVLLDKDAQD